MAKKLALIVLLFLCSSLYAEKIPTFTVGIIALSEDQDSLVKQISDAAVQFGSHLYLDEQRLAYLGKLETKQATRAWEAAVATAYEKHDLSTIAENLPVSTVDGYGPMLAVSYEMVSYDQDLAKALLLSDDACTWFMGSRDYHALLLVETQTVDAFRRIRVSFFIPDQERKVLIDQLVQHADYENTVQNFRETLLSYMTNDEEGVLVLPQQFVGLQVQKEGETLHLDGQNLMLPKGAHTLVFSEKNHEQKTVSVVVQGGTFQQLDLFFDPIVFPPLNLYSSAGSTAWFVNGEGLGKRCSISLDAPTYPLVVTVEKEGYSQKTIQLDGPLRDELLVNMHGMLLSDSALLEEAKQDFYKQLRNTILLFGSSVCMQVLSKTYAVDNPLWQVGLVGTSSLSLVSAVALVKDLASYAAVADTII